MPEIIEVEITKQKLTLALEGKRILNFWTDCPLGLYSEVGGILPAGRQGRKVAEAMKNLKIESLSRKGKVVVINLDNDMVIALHQRMSGHIRHFVSSEESTKPKHAHFIFELNDGSKFMLIDPRKFGTVWFGSKTWFENHSYIKKLGKDILNIKKDDFVGI
ncbi:MAG: DNA-formamidopyrimidine glycosylase family protein, partial [Candidatus Spechtbacteria bacterium]|nr:DNA-formamidopyrimidine glycosylase family protein [Candidatus Spechtbacteria bacterium]